MCHELMPSCVCVRKEVSCTGRSPLPGKTLVCYVGVGKSRVSCRQVLFAVQASRWCLFFFFPPSFSFFSRRAHALTYIHTYIHTHTHTYIHTYIHTHIHTHIHTYIYTGHLGCDELDEHNQRRQDTVDGSVVPAERRLPRKRMECTRCIEKHGPGGVPGTIHPVLKEPRCVLPHPDVVL